MFRKIKSFREKHIKEKITEHQTRLTYENVCILLYYSNCSYNIIFKHTLSNKKRARFCMKILSMFYMKVISMEQ